MFNLVNACAKVLEVALFLECTWTSIKSAVINLCIRIKTI